MLLFYAAVAMLAMSLIAFARFVIGPTLADRMVSFDVMNSIIVVSMLLFGAFIKEPMYFDVAMVYAILSFASTIAVAKYIEGTI